MKKFFVLTSLAIVALLAAACGEKTPPTPDPEPESPVLNPVQQSYTMKAEGGSLSITLTTNQDLTANSDQSWLKVVSTKATRSATVTVSADPNTSESERTATVTVTGGTLSVKITVKQEGKEPEPPAPETPVMNVTTPDGKTTCEVAPDGGSFVVKISHNYEVKTAVEGDWISVAQTKAATEDSYTVVVAKNETYEARTGKVKFTSETLNYELTVSQKGQTPPAQEDPVLENRTASSFKVAAEGETITVKVGSNIDYSTEIDASWISKVATKAVTEDVLNFSIAANESTDSRTGHIVFKYGSTLAVTVTVEQEGKTVVVPDEENLEVAPTSLEFGADGGSSEVTVTTNVSYTATSSESWAIVSVSGNKVTVTAAANETYEARTATITVKGKDKSVTVSVSQSAKQKEEDDDDNYPYSTKSDLSAKGTANCYIVTKAGSYSFDASVIGNGEDGWYEEEEAHFWPLDASELSIKSRIKSVVVVWDKGNVINNVALESSTKRVTFEATGNKGNAMIAVKDKYGDICWSWHIWCTDPPQEVTHTNSEGDDFTLMDRNVGAVSALEADGKEKTWGFWYQWGRKDPLTIYKFCKTDYVYLDAHNQVENIEGSLQYPDKIFGMADGSRVCDWAAYRFSDISLHLWGNPEYDYYDDFENLKKTIFDPCPVGYMVPPANTWLGMEKKTYRTTDHGMYFPANDGKEEYYPFQGYGDNGDSWGGDPNWYGYEGYVADVPHPSGGFARDEGFIVAMWTSGSGFYTDINPWAGMMFIAATKLIDSGDKYVNTEYPHVRQRQQPVRCVRIK
ncbi:MAG: BACON domain-containing protein [Bacteroidales bacterium]|nr:BACON domain-containing protein [Bacteroidales bacterium]